MSVIVNGTTVTKINVVKSGVTTAIDVGYCDGVKVFSSDGLPDFTYTGSCTKIDDGSGNWRIKFLTSGTLVFTGLIGASNGIDVFLCGGGASGNACGCNAFSSADFPGGGGGGGGYTKTVKGVSVTEGTSYSIVIGAGGNGVASGQYTHALGNNGGITSAFGYSAYGGVRSTNYYGMNGGDGGSGGGGGGVGFEITPGAGGTNGGNGSSNSKGSDNNTMGCYGGTGQGTTTCEFGESSGTLYCSGGAGGSYSGAGTSGGANTGTGGGGAGWNFSASTGQYSGSGGSGIVVIRNKR